MIQAEKVIGLANQIADLQNHELQQQNSCFKASTLGLRWWRSG